MKLYNYIREPIKDTTAVFLFNDKIKNHLIYKQAKVIARNQRTYAFEVYDSGRNLVGYGIPDMKEFVENNCKIDYK